MQVARMHQHARWVVERQAHQCVAHWDAEVERGQPSGLCLWGCIVICAHKLEVSQLGMIRCWICNEQMSHSMSVAVSQSKHVPMKGDARATKEASPTPTNMRHMSRLQNPAGGTVSATVSFPCCCQE